MHRGIGEVSKDEARKVPSAYLNMQVILVLIFENADSSTV